MKRRDTRYLLNRSRLTDHGNRRLRDAACEIIESAIGAADPYHHIKEITHLKGDVLLIAGDYYDLKDYENIYLIGAGKATARMGEALEDILGERITGGILALKQGTVTDLKRVRVIEGAHPIPDHNGFRAAKAMLSLAKSFTQKDLVIAAFSGGSSALLPYPVEGISLEEKQKIHKLLLWSGADITEINTVRKHLSQIKGGRLAQAIFPATLINMTVSDVVGDPLDYITDPTVPDTSTFADARAVLNRYGLWEEIPESARQYLQSGRAAQETPKDFGPVKVNTYLVVDSRAACAGAARRAEELGFQSMLLTSMLKGEAKDAGLLFAAIAREIVRYNHPLPKPCAILAGGENTVTIGQQAGVGGPNQEFALSASQDISGMDDVIIVSVDTDGTDGPTIFAGGMVDGGTACQINERHHDITAAISAHNATPLLDEIGDAIQTGHTGTNVNDLKLLLVR